MLNCESSEAKRICSIVEKIISKRSEPVYIEEFKYRSEANRFDSDFVFKKTKQKKWTFFFFLNEGQKSKGFDSKLSKFCHSYVGLWMHFFLAVPMTSRRLCRTLAARDIAVFSLWRPYHSTLTSSHETVHADLLLWGEGGWLKVTVFSRRRPPWAAVMSSESYFLCKFLETLTGIWNG